MCAAADPADVEPSGCMFYGGSVIGLAYCCNGYVANRTNVIVDSPSLECCSAALPPDTTTGGLDELLDSDGVYDKGLLLKDDLVDLDESQVVCAEFFGASGVPTNEHVMENGDAFIRFAPALIVGEGSERVLRCDYHSLGEPIVVSPLGIKADTDWPPGKGLHCDELQEQQSVW